MATFMERLSFLQNVPMLMKATADDDSPCPGYLFQEIGKLSHVSLGYSQCLLEYLLERLQVKSCHVKLKVLKIFVHLCDHGSNQFLTELRRNSTFIQQASVYSGPPDPIHDTALYQRVRNTAQEVARLLFTDTTALKNSSFAAPVVHQTMGMGSAAAHTLGMQGFGYSPDKQGSGNISLLDKIQKAAEVVASAVLPPTELQGIRLYDNHYRAVVAPSASIEVAVPACSYSLAARKSKVTQRCPGQIGGGWEDTDSTNCSSHNSSQDVSAHFRGSTGRGSAGTGSQSGASRESSADPSERFVHNIQTFETVPCVTSWCSRVEGLQIGDCGQEVALISTVTEGTRVFLSREEGQHFIKESSTLNCEVLVDLLSKKLQDPSGTIKMRTMCALACLMTSDLISLEQIFAVTQSRLYLLSEGPPGAVANKATKLLRQFEALTRGSQPLQHPRSAHHTSDLTSPSPESVDLTVAQQDTDIQTHGCSVPSELHTSHSDRLSLFSGMELVTKSCQTQEDAIFNVSLKENTEHCLTSLTEDNSHLDLNSVSSGITETMSAFSFLNS